MATVFTKSNTTTRVNAAFLQEVKDNNVLLWSTLRELRKLPATCVDPIVGSAQFVTWIGRLRELLSLQFSLEDTYGYIEASPAVLQLSAVADAGVARAQHCELYLQIHELCEQAEEAQYRGTISRDLKSFFEAFELLDESLQAHEEAEAELIRLGLGLPRH
jgi:hypothetical protein